MATVNGSPGNDSLVGTSAADSISGFAGEDTLDGLGGVDTLVGGTGNDAYFVTAGDILSDSSGTDTAFTSVSFSLGASSGVENLTQTGTASGVVLNGNQLNNVITGSDASNASINGRAGDDTMFGMGGNDTFDMSTGGTSSYGNDVIDGGSGVDTIDFGSNARSALVVNLASGIITGGGDGGVGSIQVSNVENVGGGAFADEMTGNSSANFLFGGAGNDTLNGGAGADRLEGGTGSDDYVFSSPAGATNADTVVGFASGSDRIVLDGAALSGLGAEGQFSSGDARFRSGAGVNSAQDSTDRVVYNTSTGQLWLDSDGAGGAAAQLIATLQGAPSLLATNIHVENGAGGGATAGDDSLVGTPGNDTIDGLAGNDTIDGFAGDDSLIGGSGNDSLIGGAGTDTLDGGIGDDRFEIDRSDDVIVDSGGMDSAVLHTDGVLFYVMADGLENLILRGNLDSWSEVHGNALDNHITSELADSFVLVMSGGEGGNDTLVGGAGQEFFGYSEGDGFDVIIGGGGDDFLFAGGTIDFRSDVSINGIVHIFGGGADHFTLDDAGHTVWGGSGDDTLIGGAGNDSLYGEGFFDQPDDLLVTHDSLVGGGGSDTLNGGRGNDTLDGGLGNDTLNGGPGPDPDTGDASRDNFVFSVTPGAANADSVFGFESGNDLIVMDPAAHANIGGSGFFAPDDARYHSGAGVNSAHDASDRVIYNSSTGQLWYDSDGTGASGPQLIATLQGAPAFVATDIFVAFGPSSGVLINGTAGDDSLTGTSGNDTINGLGGNDTINGAGGSDSMNGGIGNDSLTGGGDPQEADGGDILVGGDGNDTLNGFNHALFNSDPDIDTMNGGLGDDVFWADNAADVLVDAGGMDTVHALTDWTLGAGFENLVLHTDEAEFGFGTGNALANHMSVTYRGSLSGMGGNDTLIGAGGTLDGGDGNDLIQGNLANFAVGGAGNDTIMGAFQATGGAGADVFHADFFDNITDFTTSADTLLLDGAFPGFANAGPSGRFSAGDARFHAAAGADAAHDASDRLIYNTTTGDLYYDSDGTGSNGAFHLGVLDGAPTLAATDIEVIHGTAPEPITGTEGNDTLTGTSGDDTIDGLGGNDQISGLEGADSLIGGAGNDTLDAGQDSTTGDGAADTLDGGLGDDHYFVSGDGDIILADAGGIDTVFARNADWTLGAGLENLDLVDTVGSAFNGTGNALDNVIRGASEGGTLMGLGGNDTLILRNVQNFSDAHGGDGNDTLRGADQSSLSGNAGNDVLIAGLVLNVLTGGTGNDHFVFEQTGSGADIADFASGTDKVRLDATTMTALGTTGNFAAGDERFHAGAAAAEADDRVIWNAATGELLYDADGSGSGAAELITTATGNVVATDIIVDNGTEPEPGGEVITGTAGNDSLVGTNGNDTLDGVSGNDTLNGLLGDDTYIAQTGDVIQDSGGTDTLVTTSTWNIFSMPIENVTLAGSSNIGLLANNLDNHVIGNSAANSIEGRGGSDTIEGGGGNDYFKMTTGGGTAFGFDVIDGGDGIDTVDYGGTALSDLDVDLVAGTVTGGDAGGGGGATITSIEKFISGNFNDRVSGSAENNQLLGNGGNDTLLGLAGHDSLNGGDGNDWLEGGSGFDTLVGGAGNDSFVFSATSGRVTDFVAADQLLFDNAFFAALGAESTWAVGDGRFRAAAGATTGADADDRLVYNTTNGNLYYDADGAGGTGSVLVTTLQSAPTLSAADITVI